jgi:hypothetical protein
MRTKSWVTRGFAAIGFSSLLLTAGGCERRAIPPRVTTESVEAAARRAEQEAAAEKAALAALLEGGELVHATRFIGSAVPAEFSAERLTDEPAPAIWRVEAGWLRNDNAKNQGMWVEALPEGDGPVRIEFSARSVKPPGNRPFPGDIKIEAFATRPAHEAGYSFINGGWSNQFDTIARLGEHSADDKRSPAKPVEEGKTYRYAIVRRGGRLDFLRDGELLYRYEDAAPVTGRWIGFNNWLSDVSFRDLKVFRLEAP